MTVEELLTKLNITYPGIYEKEDTYVVDIPNSDAYGKIESKLDRSDLVEETDERGGVANNVANVWYTYDDLDSSYDLDLEGDFDNDEYRLYIMTVSVG